MGLIKCRSNVVLKLVLEAFGFIILLITFEVILLRSCLMAQIKVFHLLHRFCKFRIAKDQRTMHGKRRRNLRFCDQKYRCSPKIYHVDRRVNCKQLARFVAL